MQIINFSVNLNKVDKSKIIKGKKGKYLPLTAFIQDEEDQYGNNVAVIQSQDEDERKNKTAKNYVANGKVVFQSEANAEPQKSEPKPKATFTTQDDNDGLPF
jgi:hypothetical protein